MNIRRLLVAVACVAQLGTAQTTHRLQDKDMEQQIETLLQRMTLQEKIGQMTEMVLDLVVDDVPNKLPVINEQKLDTLIRIYKVGSLLNVPRRTPLSPAAWQNYMEKVQEKSMRELGIPCIFGLDQNHGSTYTNGGTLFPQNINIGASFNREIAKNCAEICAYETRAGSIPWTFSPVLDLASTPLWPRAWEGFGEDCYLTAEMGKAAVTGFQGNNPNKIDQQHVAACLKHYFGYGSPVSGKDRTPSVITPMELREKHFAPFKAAIEAGALSVMVNSSSVNYVPVHSSHEWLTEWLKEDLNWDGVIVTDWGDINNLYKREKVAANKKEAICLAINAGIDMAMEPYDYGFCTLLNELVNEGRVPMSRIDDATRRVLRMKLRLGLFDQPTQNHKQYPKFGSNEFSEVALLAAEESMVLLKNVGNMLPLAKGKRYLVTGPNANAMRCLNGGWSYTWQGEETDKYAESYNTIFEALQLKFGKENVNYVSTVEYKKAWNYYEAETFDFAKAVKAAKNADVIICCIGENSYCETPGNLSNLELMQSQQDAVKALAKTGKPIVLLLNEGRPRLINGIKDLAPAIVDMLIPGNRGGDAIANLLSGEVNFSGKLPYTYPAFANALSTYDYRQSEVVGTMFGAYNYSAKIIQDWPFGFGLSYTEFEYSDLKVDKTNFTANDVLTVSVKVKNTGKVQGKESVLLYSTDLLASIVPENKRLRNFSKVNLNPGESTTVTFKLKGTDLAFVGYDNKWTLEAGEFDLTVGNQHVRINCTATQKW
ncbi:MAG: glycoside hydrolase family 3 C-terminal domain-containing protein [Paludibacteraceae bacterium]|nr:glycoside hydrolase family 3 C-terminal domain-containing protein [Paludibacteraceae bacterium]